MRMSEDFLKPGMVVTKNVYKNDNDKIPVFLANRVLSEKDIEVLKKLNQRIKEENAKNPNFSVPLVSLNIKTNIDNNETVDQDTKEAIMEELKRYDIAATIEKSKTMVQRILSSRYYSYDLSKYLMKDNDEYSAAVEIAGFAVALGKVYNKLVPTAQEINLQSLAAAALLNNIGSICKQEIKLISMRDEIKQGGENTFLDKRVFTGYNDSLFDSYNENAKGLYGYAVLKNDVSVSAVTKVTILLQDENLKGTGALKTLPKFMAMDKNPSVFASKILRICKEYDRVLNEVLKQGETPSNVIEVMQHLAESKEIDITLTRLFLKSIPLYSVGTRVVLSNNLRAIVKEINPYLLDRPKVEIEGTGNILDLSKMSIITIKRIADYKAEDIVDKKEEVEENKRIL